MEATTATAPAQRLTRTALVAALTAEIQSTESLLATDIDDPDGPAIVRSLVRKRAILKLLDVPRVVADANDGRVLGDRVMTSWFRDPLDRRFFIGLVDGVAMRAVVNDFGTLVKVDA